MPKEIQQYEHADKTRPNNPPVGLVTPRTDPDAGKKVYAYDPHLDPSLQWAGKAERLSFAVPTVSLHVHERIDPRTIVEAVRRQEEEPQPRQYSLFETPAENPPLRSALDFYRHAHGWSNRLIAGNSLFVMNSLLEKEGMAGKVQMVYIDPPYGIKYGSNFQPFVNRRDVKDGKDEDLTQEPEVIQAFRDTWELGIHSYLSDLRDRLLLARDLLHESGSIFVQISDENLHHVREVMEEVFTAGNFVSLIAVKKTSSASSELLAGVTDFLLWYARDKRHLKYRQPYLTKAAGAVGGGQYNFVEEPDGTRRAVTRHETHEEAAGKGRLFCHGDLTSQRPPGDFPVEFGGQVFRPRKGYWKTGADGMEKLKAAGRLLLVGNTLRYIRFLDDFPVYPVTNLWDDTVTSGFDDPKVYVVQTNTKIIERCLLMTTDPGDLVLDPTCGSGTTAYVAEQWGRRWITCDTSRVALALAKQRLMTAVFDYYQLAHPEEGVGSGFVCKKVPHVTLKSIANNPDIREGMSREAVDAAIRRHAPEETLYDQPVPDRGRLRVTGPFTVEAVPAPVVRPIADLEAAGADDASAARSGEGVRQAEWRDELLKTGVRAKDGKKIEFSRVEVLPGTRWLHADAETKGTPPSSGDKLSPPSSGGPGGARRAVVSFGPEFAPLEQRQVEMAWEEARTLEPRPQMILFAAFQFDAEAAKDIEELTPEKTGMTFLAVQMNTDLLTDDLKKKRASNQSFWLIGQPEVVLSRLEEGQHAGKCRVEVLGFDYYNPVTGVIEGGDARRIALWLLDTDYDGRSLYPRQVFFPMSGEKDGWSRLARNLRAEVDEELIEQYRGTVSLPFEAKAGRRVAVKMVDDRGIESLKVLEVK